MNIERKYIEKMLVSMENRLEYVTNVKCNFEEEGKELEVDSYGAGLYKGNIIANKNEIEFLEREIKFLKGALEN